MKRFHRRYIKSRALFAMMVILITAVILYIIVSLRIMPIVKTKAVNKAINIATQTINSATGKVLCKDQINYDKLMSLEKDGSGKITAVKANSLQIDKLKYEITNECIKELDNIDSSRLDIPIGTVLGGQFFSGTGPAFSVKIEPVGSVETELANEFTSTGINQTRQQILLKVMTSITIIVSSYSVSTNVESNFTIADTVIVGSVPDSYTVVEGGAVSGKSNTDKIFTFGGNRKK